MPRLKEISISLLTFLLVWFWPASLSSQVAGSIEKESGEGLFKSTATRATLGLTGLKLYESSQGKKHWHIESKFAELHRKENYALLHEVDSQFFASKTGNVLTTKSNLGHSFLESQKIHLIGNVQLQSKQGYLFTMPTLYYLGEKHEFQTSDFVQMRGLPFNRPNLYLRGKGLWADIDQERFTLRQNVSGHRKLRGNEWMRVRSRSGEFFAADQRAVFQGNVKSVLPKVEVDSDRMEMNLDSEDESILARGNVRLRNRKQLGKADYALIKMGSDRIILEGKAQVSSEGSLIEGNRIILYTNDDHIEVVEAKGTIQ